MTAQIDALDLLAAYIRARIFLYGRLIIYHIKMYGTYQKEHRTVKISMGSLKNISPI